MTETSELLPSTAVETAPAPGITVLPVAPSPAVALLDFSPAVGESDRAFEAFRAYLELGPRRRYAAAGRKVSVTLRTIQRWANDFDWRSRIQAHAARSAEQFVQTETAVQRDVLLDAAARAQAFRDRQYALAESILEVAERQLERVDEDDLDQVSFSDVCKAVDVASRLARHARETPVADTPDQGLRDQLAALLDQVCGETLKPS